MLRVWRTSLTVTILLLAPAFGRAAGAEAPAGAAATTAESERPTIDTPNWPRSWKERAIESLPPAISDGLEVNLWGWFSYLHDSQRNKSNLYDIETSLDVTRSFHQGVAVSGEVNFIDANGVARAELEQAYLSALALPEMGTIVTVGRFNANFGVEARDYWNRTTGTTSLLFGAQPQDLIGVMITQPIGATGITLRPFVSSDFQAAYDFNEPPAGGLQAEYRPCKAFDIAVTNWVGPGVKLGKGEPLRSPYDSGGYEDSATSIFGNWQGPKLFGRRGDTLYFLDARVTLHPTSDLTLSAEYLLGTTSSYERSYGWYGCMALANYDVTDRLHAFARLSYLYDSDWLITGEFQHMYEASGGIGYEIYKDLEFRGEYRHDFSNVSGCMDSFSLHLSFGI